MTQPKGCPLSGALKVSIVFHCRQPKKPSNVWPIGDIDNHVKGILDSLNGWAWLDDVQITLLTAKKCYSSTPRIEIEWEEHNVGSTERVRLRST